MDEERRNLDCRGKDSGEKECWPNIVNVTVPIALGLAFFGFLLIQFIVWPWTKDWVLGFFEEQGESNGATSEKAGNKDDRHVMVMVDDETNLAASVDSIKVAPLIVTSSTKRAENETTVTHL